MGGLLAHFTDKETEAWPASGSWTGTQAAVLSTETPVGGAGLGDRASRGACSSAVGPGTALGLPASQTTDPTAENNLPQDQLAPSLPLAGGPTQGDSVTPSGLRS